MKVKRNMRIYKRLFKRPMDFVLSLLGLLALSPVFVIVAIYVRLKIGNPVIFTQQRPGLNENVFTFYKFRTMNEAKCEKGKFLPDSERLNNFGSFLRTTSLDELPELWNILRGDMSIVGPRPLLVQYLDLYDNNQKRRHEVRPGLTGLAQVNGRNAINWEDRFKLDVEYVDNITFIGDLKIIFLTVKKVIMREGINSETSVTMESFKGSGQSRIMKAQYE